ncbi:carboxypeptidase-like regulatory domain-containing protein, partial [Winogradskyella sp. UBA3174]
MDQKKKWIRILLFTINFTLYGFAQQTLVQGKVTDSIQNPLPYANILAIPQANDQDVKFAISENDGSYKLGLVKNQTYEITVSYLGYKPQTLTITTADQDVIKNFTLKENPDQLDEVIIKYTPPITVKKDTITYDVTKFVTGEERKLRDALKKLPGVEVDREGNVMV